MQLPRAFLLAAACYACSAYLTSCSSAADDAVDAVCKSWRWDPEKSVYDNVEAKTNIEEHYDTDATGVELLEKETEQCPEVMGTYNEHERAAEARMNSPQGLPEEEARAEDSTTDRTVDSALSSRGLSATDVTRLGAVANQTNYGLGPGTVMSFDQAQDLALAMMLEVCDKVAAGDKTWDDQIAQDVADGASSADAREMNAYLKNTFCPLVR